MERNTEHEKIGAGRGGEPFGDTAPEKLVGYLTRSCRCAANVVWRKQAWKLPSPGTATV